MLMVTSNLEIGFGFGLATLHFLSFGSRDFFLLLHRAVVAVVAGALFSFEMEAEELNGAGGVANRRRLSKLDARWQWTGAIRLTWSVPFSRIGIWGHFN